MNRKTQHIRGTNAGFTLMELLIVIAIIGVMVAITAPSLAPLLRSTEMNRLDNYAKELYVAVQDQFISMEATGEYAQFNETLRAATASRNLGTLGAMPQDATSPSWANYYYLTNFGSVSSSAEDEVDAAFAQVVARTAVVDGLTSGARYIVEVNPRLDGTDVYAVFYSEDPNFSYADVVNLASRERASRMDTGNGYPVGYYCGTASLAQEMPDYFAPRATFVNGEELFLRVVCTGGFGLLGQEQNIEMKLTLTDGQETQVFSYFGGQDFSLTPNGNIDLDIVLDSMRSGLHLADLFPAFTPGADIEATVEITFTGADTTISTPAEARGQAKANSLYAKNVDGVVEVANVRHMANLDLLPTSAVAVNQVANIDFDATSWGASEHTQLSQATRQYNESTYGTAYINPLDLRTVEGAEGFSPINTSGASWMFDGRGNTLQNFYIQGSGQVGLFAAIQSAQVVRNTTLVDPTVLGSGVVGALCGQLEGQLDSCGVRLDVRSAEDVDKVLANVVQADSGSAAGGLVGQASGSASIANSFGAINVLAPSVDNVGGLVGSFVAAGSISSSYASGELDGANNVGGLVGSLEGGSIENCYATSNLYASGTAGGLVGQALAGSVSGSRALGQVNTTVGGGLVGSVSGATFSNCLFLEQVDYNDNLAGQPEGVEGADYATLAATRLAADHSFPYRESLMGQPFPFANVLEEHWGNWPAPVNMNPLLVYYELYGDGTYGYFGTGQTPESIVDINTLDETLVVLEDGYALLATYPVRGLDYVLNGSQTGRLTLSDAASSSTYVELPTEGVEYWNGTEYRTLDEMHAYQLPFELQMPSRTAEAYLDTLELTLAGAGGTASQTYTYYYNPDFAKLSASPDPYGTTEVPSVSTLLVRTARQLNRLAAQPAYWGASIAQERDIDFAYYETSYFGYEINYMNTAGAYANAPIGVAGQPFTGTFDGRNNVIIDYNQRVEGAAEAGLFGEVSGTVRNVHVAASEINGAAIVRTGSMPVSNAMAVGVVVGWLNGGSVSGSSVSGYQVFLEGSGSTSDACVGGLVGINQGSVSTSSAANVCLYSYIPSASGAALGIGGLVGGSSGNISRSYSVENIFECRTTTSGSGRSIAFGGIVGTVYSGNPRISDCYAYSYVDAAICAEGDTVTHFDIANPAYCTISNCYRLSPDYSGSASTDGAEVASCNPAELQSVALAGFQGPSVARVTYAGADSGHVVNLSDYYAYPYPVICQDAYGTWAHFGFDWRE